LPAEGEGTAMAAEHDMIPEAALAWSRAGKGAALATVVETWGSAPRPTGSQLAISGEAEIAGSVSGGCVEGAVVAEALEALGDGQPRILEYGVSDAEAFAVGLACGGRIRVMVEPIGVGDGPGPEVVERLAAARLAREPVVYAVRPDGWERRLVSAGGADPLSEAAAAALMRDRSGFAGDWFLGVHNPPLRMAVVGAVHIAQALVPMARIAGYDVAVVDPREAFASEGRFPGTTLSHDWPDAALAAFGLDTRTAVVTLTHDPKLDDPAIAAALRAPVFYLGCLGSSRTHAKRVERLKAAGFGEAEIARIHAPIGADIGAQSPAEIALAILAEVTERLRRPGTRR
jgi:xanthine dehydrogenase accessory factor